MAKFYKVGGCVRDAIMGRKCHDIDYSVEAESYKDMKREIKRRGGEIFLENEEFFTIRARVPNMGACDFVLCRKDGQYSDGRHPDTVEHGTIKDDLARRDFTMNAIAINEDGNIFDPHNGKKDIKEGIIRCVGDPQQKFAEDSLRLLRVIRFSVVLGFQIEVGILACLSNQKIVDGLASVSVERIREELLKAFKSDTSMTLQYLTNLPALKKVVFDGAKLWLMPTLRQ